MTTERTYNIPLRKAWLKVPKYKRAKKAVSAARVFLKKHLKAKTLADVKLGIHLNLHIWKHGIKNPPHHVRVNVTKDDKGIVTAEIVGAPVEKPKEETKKGLLSKVKDAVTGTSTAKKEVIDVEAKTTQPVAATPEAPSAPKTPAPTTQSNTATSTTPTNTTTAAKPAPEKKTVKTVAQAKQ